MSTQYEPPTVKILGTVTDLTQKGGIYFDFPGSTEGKGSTPPPGAPGTTPS